MSADNQAGENSENTTTEMQAFKNDIWSLQRQLSAVEERMRSEQARLAQLESVGAEIQSSQGYIQGLLGGTAAALRSINGTLESYGGLVGGLQGDTGRLQREVQRQAALQDQALLEVGGLNATQAQQRGLIASLQRSVDDASQAIQKMRDDFQSLEQAARQARSDAQWLRGKVDALQGAAGNASAQARANSDGLEELGQQLALMAGEIHNASGLAEGHERSLRDILERQGELRNLSAAQFQRMEARLDAAEQGVDRVTGNVSFSTQLLGSINLRLNDLRGCSETVGRHSDFLLHLNGSVADVRTDAASLRAQQEELSARLDKEVSDLSVVMEEMKLVDTKHSQLITNFTILKGER